MVGEMCGENCDVQRSCRVSDMMGVVGVAMGTQLTLDVRR